MLNIRFRDKSNPWPGFVDLFSNLVIILIFLLIVFMFLWTTTGLFSKTTGIRAVKQLRETNAAQAEQIEQMSASQQEARRLLIMAHSELENLESNNAELVNELQEMDLGVEDLITAYEAKVNELQSRDAEMQAQITLLTAQLTQAQIDKEKTAQLEQERRELQNQMDAQRATLNDQLEQLRAALDAAEDKSRQQEVEYVEMSTRLNKALADKVAELNNMAQYQSAFYRAVKMALGDRTTVRDDGDRFIVSSDILFPSGSYKLSPAGKKQLAALASVIKDFEEKIPSDINWIIRIDGHTDKKQVVPGTRGYKDNMQLSLLRATAVADELARAGVSRRRLVPSGFGELHPVALGNDAASLQQNRRIELQLTNQ